MAKQRLDLALVERGLAASREQARAAVEGGRVLVAGRAAVKPAMLVGDGVALELLAPPRYVSRGGEKLEHALRRFAIDVSGLVAADIGASTGGFSDCLLQRGAARVYAIDVGYGQIDYRLRKDTRVVLMEQTNARYVETLPESISFVSIDASFISLSLLLPVVKYWLSVE